MRRLVIPVIFFAFVLLAFLTPLGTGDLWWHLGTGKWIAEHHALPQQDPFSYTSAQIAPNIRTDVVLKGFWLAQVIIYAAYAAAGLYGLVALKAALLAFGIFAAWRLAVHEGLDPVAALIITLPSVYLLRFYDDLRPQLISFTLVVAIVGYMDAVTARLRAGKMLSWWLLAAGPALMVIWANVHRGYMLGHAVIAVYALAELGRAALRREPLASGLLLRFLALCAVMMLSAGINPAGFEALAVNAAEMRSSTVQTINEYLPLWQYAAYEASPSLPYVVLGFGAAVAAAVLLTWRRVDPAHAMLLAGFGYEGYAHFRFCILFFLVATVICARQLAVCCGGLKGRMPGLQIAALGALMAVLGTILYPYNALAVGGPARASIPAGAIAYIKNRGLPPRIFHPYEWGDIVTWGLYPAQQDFIDGRALDAGVLNEYSRAYMGDQDEVFKRWGIATVMIHPFDPNTLNVPGLVFKLLKDPSWKLSYQDGVALVFVRVDAAPALAGLDKGALWGALEATAQGLIAQDPADPRPRRLLAEVYAAEGRTNDGNGAVRRR